MALLRIRRATAAFEGVARVWSPTRPSPSPLLSPHPPIAPTVTTARSPLRPPPPPAPNHHVSPSSTAREGLDPRRPLPLKGGWPAGSSCNLFTMRNYAGSPSGSVLDEDREKFDSGGRESEDRNQAVPDKPRPLLPSLDDDNPLMSLSVLCNPDALSNESINGPRIVHREARVLMPKLSIIQGRCIDEGSFHVNFDHVKYCKLLPLIEEDLAREGFDLQRPLPLLSKKVRGGSPVQQPLPPPRYQSVPTVTATMGYSHLLSQGGWTPGSSCHMFTTRNYTSYPSDLVSDKDQGVSLSLSQDPHQKFDSSGRESEHENQAMPDQQQPLLPSPDDNDPLMSLGVPPNLDVLSNQSTNGPRILHREARVLMPKLSIIQGRCIDEGSFHVNFDPVEYCKLIPVIEKVPILGTTKPQEFFHKFTDDGLVLFRSLPSFLSTLHETGNCLSPSTPLTLDNIVITSGGKFQIRAELVKFVPIGSSEGGSIVADYQNASRVLKTLLRVCYGLNILKCLPEDIDSWFYIMEKCGKFDGYIIRNHASLLPLHNRANVFMKIFKLILTDIWNVNENAAMSILRQVPIIYRRKGWHETASKNEALKPWFDYRPYYKTRHSLFYLHRNSFCHRETSPDDLDLLLYSLFPNMLCRAQESLWHSRRRYQYFLEVENDFGEKKSSN